jgi:peptidoglycan/LPS O-acetylase OafA/YrhL
LAPPHLGYRPALDGLRAVAVALVVASHLAIPYAGGGVIGVDIFFVLSGFLITSLLLEERSRSGHVDFVAFYRRRALRLFPALVLLLPVVVGAAMLSPTIDRETATLTREGVPWVVFYAANWARATGVQLGLFGHTWSLAIEEQFYLTWPILLVVLVGKDRRYGRAILVSLAAVILVAAHRAVEWSAGAGIDRVANGTDMRADSLLIGCAVALAMHRGLSLRPPLVLIALAVGFLGFVVVTQSGPSPFMYLGGLTLVALAAGVVILALLETPGPLGSRPFVAIGKISYGIYLWHFPMVFLVPFSWPLPARVCVVVALTLLAASSSWWIVEERFLRLKRSRLPSRASLAVPGERSA